MNNTATFRDESCAGPMIGKLILTPGCDLSSQCTGYSQSFCGFSFFSPESLFPIPQLLPSQQNQQVAISSLSFSSQKQSNTSATTQSTLPSPTNLSNYSNLPPPSIPHPSNQSNSSPNPSPSSSSPVSSSSLSTLAPISQSFHSKSTREVQSRSPLENYTWFFQHTFSNSTSSCYFGDVQQSFGFRADQCSQLPNGSYIYPLFDVTNNLIRQYMCSDSFCGMSFSSFVLLMNLF